MSAIGTEAHNYVEVYDEPLHRVQWSNEYALVYTVNIPRGALTLWHRHCQDTVYCAIGDVAVAETLPGERPVVRQSTCGSAVSRAHRATPLIHQIENVGDEVVRFVAAEARLAPPLVQEDALRAEGHRLDWEAERFRVYQLEIAAAGATIDYRFHALLVALQAMSVDIDAPAAEQRGMQQLAAGDWRWLTPPLTACYAAGTRGILIEWR